MAYLYNTAPYIRPDLSEIIEQDLRQILEFQPSNNNFMSHSSQVDNSIPEYIILRGGQKRSGAMLQAKNIKRLKIEKTCDMISDGNFSEDNESPATKLHKITKSHSKFNFTHEKHTQIHKGIKRKNEDGQEDEQSRAVFTSFNLPVPDIDIHEQDSYPRSYEQFNFVEN